MKSRKFIIFGSIFFTCLYLTSDALADFGSRVAVSGYVVKIESSGVTLKDGKLRFKVPRRSLAHVKNLKTGGDAVTAFVMPQTFFKMNPPPKK